MSVVVNSVVLCNEDGEPHNLYSCTVPRHSGAQHRMKLMAHTAIDCTYVRLCHSERLQGPPMSMPDVPLM